MTEFENGIAWMIAGGRRVDDEPARSPLRSPVAWLRAALGRLRAGGAVPTWKPGLR